MLPCAWFSDECSGTEHTRLIARSGFDIKIKAPISFTAESDIHSIAIADVLTPSWNVRMRHSNAPIWVLGSGKTGALAA
eukprot:SAG11_NODE_2655_length_3123_cov_1.476852_5_plen_79_part_00